MPPAAAAILRRLVARHGPDLVIVHGDATGVDESFALACGGLGIATSSSIRVNPPRRAW